MYELNDEDWKELKETTDFQDRRDITWEKAVLTLLDRIKKLESLVK